MLHANASPPDGRYPFYARCAGKTRWNDCGLRNADCGMAMEGRATNPQSKIRNPQWSAHQRDSDISDNLERSGTHLVDRILGRVPVRIIEVHHVDRVDPDLLARHVVVRQAVPDAGYKSAAVAQVRSGAPHTIHHFGS